MKTYRFESIIQEDGVIVLPRCMQNLKQHRVKLTMVDLEPASDAPINLLDSLTRKYMNLAEEDLDITSIYEHREHQHDRGIVFD